MSKYTKMIECIREIKDSENYSSNDALVIKCFVESLLKEKLSITKLLKIEASMFYCINVIYGLIELDCKDTMSIYLKEIMPKSKSGANSFAGDIYKNYNIGEEEKVCLNNEQNTIIYTKRKSTVGLVLDFFENLALEKGKIEEKLINC